MSEIDQKIEYNCSQVEFAQIIRLYSRNLEILISDAWKSFFIISFGYFIWSWQLLCHCSEIEVWAYMSKKLEKKANMVFFIILNYFTMHFSAQVLASFLPLNYT